MSNLDDSPWTSLFQSFRSLGLAQNVSQSSPSGTGITIKPKPVGFFWDIENCPIPKVKKSSICPSASLIIHTLRNYFVLNRQNHREFEFLIATDVRNLRSDITEEISRSGGVTLAHVIGSTKNSADEKLREGMKKFVDIHGPESPTLVLISSDIDFIHDLRAYQTRLGCTIILLHGPSCSSQFRQGWNEVHDFRTFCENAQDLLSYRTPVPLTQHVKKTKKPRNRKKLPKIMATCTLGPAISLSEESRFLDTRSETGQYIITGSKILLPPPMEQTMPFSSDEIELPLIPLAQAIEEQQVEILKKKRQRKKRKQKGAGPLPLALDQIQKKKKTKRGKRTKKLKLKSLTLEEPGVSALVQPAKSDLIIDQLTQYCSRLDLKMD